MLFFSVDG